MVSLVWSPFPSSSHVPQVGWGVKPAGAKVSAHSTTWVPVKSGTHVVRGLVYQAVSHTARPARLRVFSLSLMRLSQTHEIIMRHVPCNPILPTCQLPVSEKRPLAYTNPTLETGKDRPKRRPSALFPTATMRTAGHPPCPRRQLWISRNRAKLPSMPMRRSKTKPATKTAGRGLPWG